MKSDTKRILIVVHSLQRGGTERVAVNLARELSSDADVELCLLSSLPNFYEWEGKLHHPSVILSSCRALRFFSLLQHIIQTIKRSKPQLVISLGWSTNIISILAGRCTNTQVIISERTDPRQHEISMSWRLARRLTYPYATCLVVLSENFRVHCLKWNSNIRVIPNFVRLRFLEPRHLIGDNPHLITIGRLSKEKGTKDLLKVFSKVQQRLALVRLTIIGDGPLEHQLKSLAKECHLSHIDFINDTNEVEEFLDDADLFLFSSFYEGFPNAVAEAMSAGLPVIAFNDNSGTTDLLQNCEGAILISDRDTDAMAEAVVSLLADSSRYTSMSIASLQFVKQYSNDRVMSLWRELVNSTNSNEN